MGGSLHGRDGPERRWGRRNHYGQSQKRRCDVSGSCPTADLVVEKQGVAPAAVTFWLLSQNQAQTISGVTVVSGTPAQFVKTNNSMDLQSTQKIAVIVNQEDSYLHPPAVKLDAASYEGFPLP